MKKVVLMILSVLIVSCSNGTKTVKNGTFLSVSVPSPSLTNALLEEESSKVIGVYLPPSYDVTTNEYPVLYFLSEFYHSVSNMNTWIDFQNKMDEAILYDGIEPMILVVVDGIGYYGGSFYVNSPVLGNWEDFVTEDVVNYVDENYRTKNVPESRGISGYLMGGFGALNIGVNHPDLFSIVYAMSPTIFPSDIIPTNFLTNKYRIININSLLDHFTNHTLSDVIDIDQIIRDSLQEVTDTWDQLYLLSYGSSFGYNTDAVPYIDFPYSLVEETEDIRDAVVVIDDEVWTRWKSGLGGLIENAASDQAEWEKLGAVKIEASTLSSPEWQLEGCRELVSELTDLGVEIQLEEFPSFHDSSLPNRFRIKLLPFFSENLPSD